MKIDLILMGRTSETWLQTGIGIYSSRMKHYIDFAVVEIPIPRKVSVLPRKLQCDEEGRLLLKQLEGYDMVILLDEHGKELGSVAFAGLLQQMMNSGVRRLAFVVGGAYGFSEAIQRKNYQQMSLSKMTFSHQMIRLFFTEQLYRAFTIIKGEQYHHE
jgi:23S rRNA (pseudouridine1915-N3)-methyltransferase